MIWYVFFFFFLFSFEFTRILVVFSNNPLELKQWKIVDPQSVEVSVSLYDAKKDSELNNQLFEYKDKKNSSRNFKKKK